MSALNSYIPCINSLGKLKFGGFTLHYIPGFKSVHTAVEYALCPTLQQQRCVTGAIQAGSHVPPTHHPPPPPLGPSPPLSGTQGPSFPPSIPTSEQRAVSRVFLPYKFSSRGANRSTLISAIISDSNYLQIYRQEESGCDCPGPKNDAWFHFIPAIAHNFYALNRYLERLRCVSSSDYMCLE